MNLIQLSSSYLHSCRRLMRLHVNTSLESLNVVLGDVATTRCCISRNCNSQQSCKRCGNRRCWVCFKVRTGLGDLLNPCLLEVWLVLAWAARSSFRTTEQVMLKSILRSFLCFQDKTSILNQLALSSSILEICSESSEDWGVDCNGTKIVGAFRSSRSNICSFSQWLLILLFCARWTLMSLKMSNGCRRRLLFVFACSTQKDSVDIMFTLEDNNMAIDFDSGWWGSSWVWGR